MSDLKKMHNKKTRTDSNRHLPLPLGNHPSVAFTDLMVGDSRKEGVLVRLFYPQRPNESENNAKSWSQWLPHPHYKNCLLEVSGLKSERVHSWLQRMNKADVLMPATQNGEVASGQSKYPVIVYSHGVGGFRNMSATLCIELASHGFVVAAVEHRDNSACLSFYARNQKKIDDNTKEVSDPWNSVKPDDELDFGEELRADPNFRPPRVLKPIESKELDLEWVRYSYASLMKRNEQVAAFRNKQIHQRARECSRTLDVLEALNAGRGLTNVLDLNMNLKQFEGLIDLNKLILMGYSFGGGTTLLAATLEPRFKVVVAIDPWMYPIENESLGTISQPALTITTETLLPLKENKAKLAEVMSLGEGDDPERRVTVTLNGSNHMQQCDIPFVFPTITALLLNMQFGPKMRHLTTHDLTAALALQFIGKWLDIEINKDYLKILDNKKHRIRPTFPK